ncbi:DUF6427 family protein [Cognatitamlana onchidii]|uniref:DUF6427 family protein n=1 Tax=Cognatitamlana onchidii TaxID=2562860 RepID=UPI0010A66B3D|nr:DUF6427 family protein [Algibacter onchidii]
MLTSFFNKSKPTNFIIVLVITFLAFVIARTSYEYQELTVNVLIKQVVLLLILVASIFLLNFIASKNSLTHKSNFEVLLFSLFLLLIPQTTGSSSVIVSNLFVLVALRRIVSLRSQKQIKNKLFDAAFWIGIASLFYFWSIIFFVLIILSLALYADNNLRHWIIPFLGILAVFVTSVAYSIVWNDDFFSVFNLPPLVSYDYSGYNSVKYLVAITVLLSFGIWSSFFYLQNIKKQKKVLRASFKTVILGAILSFIVVVIVPNKNGSEFLFLLAPLSIVIANYLEIINEKWFKEVFLGLLILVPFVLLLL